MGSETPRTQTCIVDWLSWNNNMPQQLHKADEAYGNALLLLVSKWQKQEQESGHLGSPTWIGTKAIAVAAAASVAVSTARNKHTRTHVYHWMPIMLFGPDRGPYFACLFVSLFMWYFISVLCEPSRFTTILEVHRLLCVFFFLEKSLNNIILQLENFGWNAVHFLSCVCVCVCFFFKKKKYIAHFKLSLFDH